MLEYNSSVWGIRIGHGRKSISKEVEPNMHISRSSRRMIKGLTVLCILALSLSGCAAGTSGADTDSASGPVSRSAFLLDTYVSVTVYDSTDTSVLDEALGLCKDYENIFSKTRETSELYRINHRSDDEQTLTVSDDMAALLEKGLYYSELSGGAFDITIEPLSSLWDFKAEEPAVPDASVIEQELTRVGYEAVTLSGNTLSFSSPDTTIDLGGIAKGYIADRLADFLREAGVESAIINLGGNVLCIGRRPGGDPFRIGLQKPFADREETFETLGIDGLSVVTSGVYERHFILDGVNYHHILDPRTGYPYQNGLISVTILSKASVDGDGLSTTCFSLGLADGLALINSLDDTWACFIDENYEVYYSDGMEEFVLGS